MKKKMILDCQYFLSVTIMRWSVIYQKALAVNAILQTRMKHYVWLKPKDPDL